MTGRWLGASPPVTAIWMAIDEKLEKPHKANVTIPTVAGDKVFRAPRSMKRQNSLRTILVPNSPPACKASPHGTSSSSHALIGGYAGAAVTKAGFGAIIAAGWTKTLVFIVLSPMIGMAAGWGLMVASSWAFRKARRAAVEPLFRGMQIASSALFSLSHGANDAQKTMGIIVSLLVAGQASFATETGFLRHFYLTNGDEIPFWVKLGAHFAIAMGTLMGGWRIVHTLGSRVTKLKPIGGFCAETGGASAIFLATWLGIPVSTTHTIAGAVIGVGATHRLSAVRWGLASRMVWAWVITIPAAAAVAGASYWIIAALRG